MPLHNTMVSPDVRLGPARGYDASASKLDLTKTRLCPEPDPRRLGDLATATAALSTLHVTQHVPPVMRVEHRQSANLAIHDYNRLHRELIVTLRHLERSAALETISLTRHRKAVLAQVERTSRMLWLGNKSVDVLSVRPTQSPGGVQMAVDAGKRDAARSKAQLEEHVARLDHALRGLQAARGRLDGLIKSAEKPIQLAPLAYSSARGAQLPDTPEVAAVIAAQDEAARLREDGNALIAASQAMIAATQNRTEAALQQSAADSSVVKGDLLAARGRALMATHEARRAAHTLDVQREVNTGPREGRFAFTRTLPSRPLVHRHSHAPSLPADVTSPERSLAAHRVLSRSLSLASSDAEELSRVHGTIEAAITDVHRDADIDTHLVRLRRRCDPGRRV